MTRSFAAFGGTIHSAFTPPALTASHFTSRATCSLTFSIAPRIRSTEAVGSRGTDLIISSTFASSALAIDYSFQSQLRIDLSIQRILRSIQFDYSGASQW